MATPAQHRAKAEDLLDRSANQGIASPGRLALLAEAQVHATLALSAPAPKPRASKAKEAQA